MEIDVHNFYLNMKMDSPEYIKITLNMIPQEIIEEYNMVEYTENEYINVEIN